jgi:predicted permease
MRVEGGAGAFYRELVERLESLPGVRAAAAVTALPMSEIGPDFDRPYWRGEEERLSRTTRQADIRMATPGYFDALGLPVIRGRRFDGRDVRGAPRVIAVSQGLARREWPGADPVGRRLRIDYVGGEYEYEVVAVVGDTRFRGLRSDPRPEIYIPHEQNAYLEMNVAVRAEVAPEMLVPAVRRAVAESDADQPIHSLVTMDQLLSRSSAGDRLAASLLAALAALAVALAAAGLYALQAYSVGCRTSEIGVRMALGAHRQAVAGLVVREALATALPGAVVGVLLALALGRGVEGLLFGVSPLDPVSLGGAALAILLVALLAAALPALRAARIEPCQALRGD